MADDIKEDELANNDPNTESALYNFLYPDKELLPEDKEMTIFDHLEELRERIFVSVLAVGAAILGCFVYSKDLIMILEAPVRTQGVRFLQLAPGEFFFTTIKVISYNHWVFHYHFEAPSFEANFVFLYTGIRVLWSSSWKPSDSLRNHSFCSTWINKIRKKISRPNCSWILDSFLHRDRLLLHRSHSSSFKLLR